MKRTYSPIQAPAESSRVQPTPRPENASKGRFRPRTGHSEREVAYCDTCGTMSPWLTAVALGERCFQCGSTRISRGLTTARYRIRESN